MRYRYVSELQRSHQVHNPLAAGTFSRRGLANLFVHDAESYLRHQQPYHRHLFMRGTALRGCIMGMPTSAGFTRC